MTAKQAGGNVAQLDSFFTPTLSCDLAYRLQFNVIQSMVWPKRPTLAMLFVQGSSDVYSMCSKFDLYRDQLLSKHRHCKAGIYVTKEKFGRTGVMFEPHIATDMAVPGVNRGARALCIKGSVCQQNI